MCRSDSREVGFREVLRPLFAARPRSNLPEGRSVEARQRAQPLGGGDCTEIVSPEAGLGLLFRGPKSAFDSSYNLVTLAGLAFFQARLAAFLASLFCSSVIGFLLAVFTVSPRSDSIP